ncbi:hypothetical protein BHE90_013571 [Fusarium euwallaceae]|uniref:Uncharacterized protein n=1 Tax=Fusarium euwallaceae TaxID=1147111 RepID=A0A430L8H8_9HYPO|nr:hypothetical protein BHE90_013571 [Fusarium euwallaceae]
MASSPNLRQSTSKIKQHSMPMSTGTRPTIPEDLPRQVRATKGAFLLTEDPNIYRWEGDALVVYSEVAMPEIEEETAQGKPEELDCSPSRFGNFVSNLSSMD